MKIRPLLLLILLKATLVAGAQNLTIFRSEKGVTETTTTIMQIIKDDKHLNFFEVVEHDQIAASRGLKIQPSRSILFENPELYTALMGCQPLAVLDLPLEILVWEENGDVYIGYIDPRFMIKRFQITGCDETMEELSRLMIRIATDAVRQL